MMTVKQALTLLDLLLKRLFADEAVPLAGNIAFRTVFSLFPFLIFLTTLAGFFGSAKLANDIITFIEGVVPSGLLKPFSNEITSILTVPRAGLLSLAAVLTVWSAMGGVDSIRVSLNRAYDIRETRKLWVLYAQNVLFVIVAAIGMLAVALLLVVLPATMAAVAAYAPQRLSDFGTVDWWRVPLAILLLLIGLIASHKLLPNRSLPVRALMPGISLTLFLWMLLTMGFSWYLHNFNSFTTTYSSLSGLFATMFFIYLQALVMIFGGEVNRVMMQVRSERAVTRAAKEAEDAAHLSPRES